MRGVGGSASHSCWIKRRTIAFLCLDALQQASAPPYPFIASEKANTPIAASDALKSSDSILKPSKVYTQNTEVLVRQATPLELLGHGNLQTNLMTVLGIEVTSDQPQETEELSAAHLDEASEVTTVQRKERYPTFRFTCQPFWRSLGRQDVTDLFETFESIAACK